MEAILKLHNANSKVSFITCSRTYSTSLNFDVFKGGMLLSDIKQGKVDAFGAKKDLISDGKAFILLTKISTID